MFRGTRLYFDLEVVNGHPVVRQKTESLPKDEIVATHEENGGVDSVNFLSWAWKCLACTKPLRADGKHVIVIYDCLLYTSPSPRDLSTSRMPSSA